MTDTKRNYTRPARPPSDDEWHELHTAAEVNTALNAIGSPRHVEYRDAMRELELHGFWCGTSALRRALTQRRNTQTGTPA